MKIVMTLKDELRGIIDFIKEKTGKTQQDIAIDMGYKKNYISEMLSPKGEVTDKFLNALKLRFSEVLIAKSKTKQLVRNENSILKDKAEEHIKGYNITGETVFVEAKDLVASFERIIEEKERVIKLIEAQAEKLERDKDRLFKALDEAQRTINEVLKPIKETTGQITANSDQNREQVLQMIQLLQEQTYIVSTQLEHQREALGLGYPGQKQKQPVPFVKTGKGSVLPRREDANKGKGG